jgi:hypothetical protein
MPKKKNFICKFIVLKPNPICNIKPRLYRVSIKINKKIIQLKNQVNSQSGHLKKNLVKTC